MTTPAVTVEQAHALAQRVHAALAADKKLPWPKIARFPARACYVSSAALAGAIEQAFGCEIEYLCGFDQQRRAHVWVQAGGLNWDITAGQFSEAPAPVVVAPQDRPHPWFDGFRVALRTFLTPGFRTDMLHQAFWKFGNRLMSRVKPSLPPEWDALEAAENPV